MTPARPTEKPKRPRGRPPKGLQPGETVRGYHRLTVRLPVAHKARLMAISTVTGKAAWQLITEAIDLLWEGQDADARAVAVKLAPRLASQYEKGDV